MSTIKSSAEDLTLNADGSGNDIKFQSNAVEKASLSDAGLLTTSGGASLDGAVTINESGADVDFRVESDTVTHALFVQGSDGAVGIGTDDPSTYGNLVLYGSGSNKTLAIIEGANSPSNNDTYGSLSFGGRIDGTITAKISGLAGNNTNATDGQLALYTADNTAGSGNLTERMRINSSGRVGIGTDSPSALFEVQTTGSTDAYMAVTNTGTGYAAIYFDASNGDLSGGDYAWVKQKNDLDLEIGTADQSSGDLIFSLNGSERARILSAVGGGITFNGDTATANALDDYEEGTWSGSLAGAVNPDSTQTITGSYVKIGKLVTVMCETWSLDATGASGQVSIVGLPFTQGSSVIGTTAASHGTASLSRNIYLQYSNRSDVMPRIASGANTVVFYCNILDSSNYSGVAYIGGSGMTNGVIGFTITYPTT